jgi:glutamine amidotransferase
MSKVAIVDYNMCNLDSVARAVFYCGGNPVITNNVKDLQEATHIILPGVGSFKQGIENIKELRLDKVLEEQVIKNKIPILGICLGMQLLATAGTEGGESLGLNFIPGKVVKLEKKLESERIPHIGWNEVIFSKKSKLFEKLESSKDFYFVHSYHFVCQNQNDILSTTPYCGNFVSAIEKDNIFGVQFHPEKSQEIGFKVIKNFLNA